jgi:hypothetical protein
MEIDLTPLVNAGLPGVLLLWFMLRLERILNRLDGSLQLMARVLIRLLERNDPKTARSLSKSPSKADGGE